jgi:serine/threonine protein kinase
MDEVNGKIYLHLNDFGLAKNLNAGNDRISSAASNIKGTEEYLAPEILNAKSGKPTITKQDVWSIGVMAYELCTFRIPFKCDTSGGTVDAIIKDTHLPIEQGYSAGL